MEQERCWTGQDRTDARKEGCRTGEMRKGRMQEMRNEEKEG